MADNHRRMLTLTLLMSCMAPSPGVDRQRHAEAIALVLTSPDKAAPLCRQIGDPALRADCVWAVVEVLASSDPKTSAALCAQTPDRGGEECWFLLGEHGQDPGACANAGTLADDCRMHVFSDRVHNGLPKGAKPGQVERLVRPWVIWAGFSPEDERPWSATYRQLLVRNSPLDPGSCAAISDPTLTEICTNTAIPVFHDLLNMHRDRSAQLCTGELPFPVVLTPALEMELADRRAQELCLEDLLIVPSIREMTP
ncbi:MAG: hypothetical protein ACI9VR_004227 [Cognaticolwellia sp.]|jgi:hypothetical protein